MVRAALSASASESVPSTVIFTRLVTPSASACIMSARPAQASSTAALSSSWVGSTPDAPLAMMMTVSFVDVEPSTSRVLNVTADAASSAARRAFGVAFASVVRHTSMVARLGAIMPTPLPMPPRVHPLPSTPTSLETVSVVIIAVAASLPAAPSFVTDSIPASTLSMGMGSPIRPVEHTATSVPATPSACAVASAIACASLSPWAPLHAFALPALMTSAWSDPSAIIFCDHFTGAALTRLRVKTPAALNSGPSLTTSAMSDFPDGLIPAVVAPAAKPCAASTPIVMVLFSFVCFCRMNSSVARPFKEPPPPAAALRSPAGRAPGSCTAPRHPRCPCTGCRALPSQ